MSKQSRLKIELLTILARSLKDLKEMKTYQLLKELYKRGIIDSPNSQKNQKATTRALSWLEDEELVNSKGGVGRSGKRWRISKLGLSKFYHFSEELTLALSIFSFIPDEFRILKKLNKFIRWISNFIKIAIPNTPISEKEITNNFYYQKPYTAVYCPIEERILEKIIKAIITKKGLRVRRKELYIEEDYKESPKIHGWREVFPISLFSYEGNLYVGALRKH